MCVDYYRDKTAGAANVVVLGTATVATVGECQEACNGEESCNVIKVTIDQSTASNPPTPWVSQTNSDKPPVGEIITECKLYNDDADNPVPPTTLTEASAT